MDAGPDAVAPAFDPSARGDRPGIAPGKPQVARPRVVVARDAVDLAGRDGDDGELRAASDGDARAVVADGDGVDRAFESVDGEPASRGELPHLPGAAGGEGDERAPVAGDL